MQKQILIERIFRASSDKQGKPYINKFNGKPQLKVSVQSEGLYYSAWDSSNWTASWTEGQVIDVDVEESLYNGKVYYNIKQKKNYLTDPVILARLDRIEEALNLGPMVDDVPQQTKNYAPAKDSNSDFPF